MSDAILIIAENIRTQDNRATDQPMFIVQKKVKDYWVHESEGMPCGEGLSFGTHWVQDSEEIDPSDEHFDEDSAYEVSWRERWEFVQSFFTEQGAKDYLRINGHNLGETRIYGWGSYRNNEFRQIRDAILAAPDSLSTPPRWTPIDEAGDWDGEMEVRVLEWPHYGEVKHWEDECSLSHVRRVASAWSNGVETCRFFVYPAPPKFDPSDYEVKP